MTSFMQSDIAKDIRECGRSVLCIGRTEEDDDDFLSFAYTIGNWKQGLPELLVIGTMDGSFLNPLSEKLIERGRAFDEGEIVSLGGKYPVKIINADHRAHDDYTIQAGQYHGTEDYPVQQVLICDRNGRFPDEPNCQSPYSTIPVLKRQH